MKQQVFKWLIIVLTVHIFSVMAGLLHGLNGQNDSIWVAAIFAASYSLASAFVVYIANRRWLVFCYAIADGLAVLFYYFAGTPQWLISMFFGIYTFGLIASTIYIQATRKRNVSKNIGKRVDRKRPTANKKNGSVRPKRTRIANSKNNASTAKAVE